MKNRDIIGLIIGAIVSKLLDRILGGTYNTGVYSQLGFSHLKIIDNKDDRIICDIVGAKRALDNTFGFVDRNSGYYFGYASGYVNEMVS